MNCVVDNRSPLFAAVENKNLDLVEFLVANGADVNQRLRRWFDKTVLQHACMVNLNGRGCNFYPSLTLAPNLDRSYGTRQVSG